MRLGNFSVLVPSGREHGTGHVGLSHGSVYQIRLGNHGNVACDAEVEIDGKIIGCFRLHALTSFNLERPADDTGRFTFFRTDSVESQQAGESGIARESKGLIRVVFKPAKKFVPMMNVVRPQSMLRGIGGQSQGGWSDGGYEKGTTTTDCAEEKTCGRIGLENAVPQNAAAGITGLTGTSGQSFYTVPNLDYDLAGVVEIALRLVCEESAAIRPLQPQAPRSTGVPSAL